MDLEEIGDEEEEIRICSKIINPNICLSSYRNRTAKTKNNRHKTSKA
jgi:hypothetical protein